MMRSTVAIATLILSVSANGHRGKQSTDAQGPAVQFADRCAKGSSITQDGETHIIEGAAGGSSYQYVAGECYDEALNPVIFHAKDGKSWIQNNQTSTNWNGVWLWSTRTGQLLTIN